MSSRNPTFPSISRTASPKPFSEYCNGRCGSECGKTTEHIVEVVRRRPGSGTRPPLRLSKRAWPRSNVRLRIAASQVSSCCATSGQSPWRARVPPGSQPRPMERGAGLPAMKSGCSPGCTARESAAVALSRIVATEVRTEFAPDSPLEGDGFEPSVPPRERNSF